MKPSIGTQTSLDSSSVVEIIAGCAVGIVVCIIIMALLILLMWCQRLRRIKNKGTQGSYLAYRVRRCSLSVTIYVVCELHAKYVYKNVSHYCILWLHCISFISLCLSKYCTLSTLQFEIGLLACVGL